jgi:hypothetical protein
MFVADIFLFLNVYCLIFWIFILLFLGVFFSQVAESEGIFDVKVNNDLLFPFSFFPVSGGRE